MINIKKCFTILLAFCISQVTTDVIYITPDLDSTPCLQQQCLTLTQLASSRVLLEESVVTLRLMSGNHYLNNQFSAANTQHFTMSTLSGVVSVTCQPLRHFTFEGMNHVSISGISFMGCNGNRFLMVANLTLSNSNFYFVTTCSHQ